MNDFDVEQAWWGKLSTGTKRRLGADPTGVVPADMVPEIIAAGGLVDGNQWVGLGQGTSGFDLPPSYKDFIIQLMQGTD